MKKEKFFLEKQESPEYELTITTNRHGPRPKEDHAGLTKEQKDQVYYRRLDDYKGYDLSQEQVKKRIIASPKIRAKETAQIQQQAMFNYGAKAVPIESDERLAEGGMSYYDGLIEQDPKVDWYRQWYYAKERPAPDVKLGWEAAADYSDWLLETIEKAKKSGGEQWVDAYSHAPVMSAFILTLEDKLGIDLIAPGLAGEDRLNPDRIRRNFPLLGSFSITTSSKTPEAIKLYLNGRNYDISLKVIKDIAKKD